MSAGTPGQDKMVRQAGQFDNFLSGAARMGGNFLVGFASGLQQYDPRNPYSSFAGGILGATPNLQTMLAEPSARRRAEFSREQTALDALSKAQVSEQVASSQAERASVMPGGEGLANVQIRNISEAIAKRPKAEQEIYDFKVGMFPSVIPQDTTSAGRVRNILMGGRQ